MISRNALGELASALRKAGSVPEVVEKRIGMSYPIGKAIQIKKEGGYTDEERIPQGTGIDHVKSEGYSSRELRGSKSKEKLAMLPNWLPSQDSNLG